MTTPFRRRTPEPAADFDAFVAARSASLRRLAVLLLGDDHLAEDAVQSALLKAWRRWDRIGGLEHVEAYVRQVVVNTVRSDRRRRSAAELVVAETPDTHGPDRVDDLVARDDMWQRLRSLPQRQRAVLVLRYYEDMTEAQIASALGCPVGTVKSDASRGLATLRRTAGAGSVAKEVQA